MRTWVTSTLLGSMLLWALGAGSLGIAGELNQDELLKRLDEQNKKIGVLMNRVKELEDQNEAVRKAINEEIDRTNGLEGKIKGAAAPSWVQKMKISGDLRYRCERILEEGKDDRLRHRFRARLGFESHPTDEVDAILRLASGEEASKGVAGYNERDPVSTNQTETGFFSGKHVWWDLACFDYHPNTLPGFRLRGARQHGSASPTSSTRRTSATRSTTGGARSTSWSSSDPNLAMP